jgi:hypothetical protein
MNSISICNGSAQNPPFGVKVRYDKYMNQAALPSVPVLTDAEMLALLAGTVTRTSNPLAS